jgi:hypothetical protein
MAGTVEYCNPKHLAENFISLRQKEVRNPLALTCIMEAVCICTQEHGPCPHQILKQKLCDGLSGLYTGHIAGAQTLK